MGIARTMMLLLVATLGGCVAPASLMRTEDWHESELAAAADDLATFDVVCLGELHDSDQGHAFQAALVELLAARRGGVVLALEMFERDVQGSLDDYLAGRIEREAFLENARPWGNYAEHYEPIVEGARRRGDPVIAANVPRPVARKVALEGLEAGLAEPFAPRTVDAGLTGAYREKIVELMRENDVELEPTRVDRAVASQCIKDDAMAESIADALDRTPGRLVVFLAGAFHVEEGLGTVERLLARRPDLRVAVVGMAGHDERDADDPEERARGRYVLYVGDSDSE